MRGLYAPMNLQQLKYLCAIVDHGLNVSDAAEALYTSQPGISKQVRQLEDELGLQVFVRQGKRLSALTPAGEIVVATARRALREVANLKRIADEFRAEDQGTLAIATTHTQARYVLPKVLSAFAAKYPKVRVVLVQGNPSQVAEHTAAGEVDVGIVAKMAYDAEKDSNFEMLDASHLFAASTTRLALKRGAFLRGYVYAFIALFAPQYARAAVDAALAGEPTPDVL